MKDMDIQGIIRGKPHRTTIPDKKGPCPLDYVNRQVPVLAPNMLRVSDFTYVATWKGFIYVAFVIDAFARKIVGWRVGTSAHARFVLDACRDKGRPWLTLRETGVTRAWGAAAPAGWGSFDEATRN